MTQVIPRVLSVALTLISLGAMGGEVWDCTSPYGTEVIVSATVGDGLLEGKVEVAGVTHNAEYKVQGFVRRWNFGLASDLSWEYTFVINPDGTAAYYDFRGVKPGDKTSSTMSFNCRQRKPKR